MGPTDAQIKPESVEQLLRWACVPLATAEVVLVMDQPEAKVRTALGAAAEPIAAGADFYWSLPRI